MWHALVNASDITFDVSSSCTAMGICTTHSTEALVTTVKAMIIYLYHKLVVPALVRHSLLLKSSSAQHCSGSLHPWYNCQGRRCVLPRTPRDLRDRTANDSARSLVPPHPPTLILHFRKSWTWNRMRRIAVYGKWLSQLFASHVAQPH